MGLWQHARLFAMLNAVMADGYIGSFATKYLDPDTKLFWRPVTAIREGKADGNPSTTGDPSWTPLRTTPPIPDYDSAHATEGGAAAAVLAAFFGDHTRFSACSISEPAADNSCIDPTNGAPKLVREFRSFSQAARRTDCPGSMLDSTSARQRWMASGTVDRSAPTPPRPPSDPPGSDRRRYAVTHRQCRFVTTMNLGRGGRPGRHRHIFGSA